MSRIPGWANIASLALRFVLFAGVAVCALFGGPAWAGVIRHVKADATGANNGLSWANAYTDLQAGLAAVSGDEIWVAEGTYKPTTGTLRTVSFVLKSGLGLYGGFAGTETELGQRSWETNATVLSGDIGTSGSAADNSYRVVVGAHLAVLDGFTITAGNASISGGGMYNEDVSPTVTNCTFSGNAAGDFNGAGGGMCNSNSSPTVTNCTFSGNTADKYGGGVEGSGTFTNCTFSGNAATDGYGGGVCGSGTFTNCTFSGNTAGVWGGGVSGGGRFTNCAFSGNTAGYGGGMDNGSGSTTLTNCIFSGNKATSNGGGMYSRSGSPTLTDCTFTANTAGSGGGMDNYNSSPTVTSCTFSGNMAGGEGGGMSNYYTVTGNSPTVINCTFSGNKAGGQGGGMHNYISSPIVANCAFSSNTAGYPGGGGMYNNGSPTVTNCIFSGNTAVSYGGGMCNWDGSPTVTNCTFSANTAGTSGGGMNSGGSTVTNCIFWDNSAPVGAEIYKGSGTPTFSHCDIKDSGGSGALWNPALGVDDGGNIMANPRFVDPDTPAGPDGLWRTRDDGLRLQSDSPCIGAADPAAAPQKDILGLPRIAAPDIGAYEFWAIIPARAGSAWLLLK